jgi:hypothetical protein
MNRRELTKAPIPASIPAMRGRGNWRRRVLLAAPLSGAILLGGCISVKAPDKPIVIELNINIRQDVVYRLAEDAEKTIDSNPGIF